MNQEEADRDIPKLDRTPAALRWLSMEPLLGLVDIGWERIWGTGGGNGIDWVVAGGESGPGARPMHPDWARKIRDDCKAAGVPFLFKQWGEWAPHERRVGGDLGGQMRRGTAQLLHAHGNPDGHFRRGDAFVERLGKKAAGRTLDGALHDGYPA